LLRFLAVSGILLSLGSFAVYHFYHGVSWDYIRGYFDRGATALITAALTALVGLLFNFREWRNEGPNIKWDFNTSTLGGKS
jgi:hypothetical protein